MNDFEHKDYFNARFCYRADEQKVTAILDSYVQNQIELADINRVIELYHTKLFFEKVTDIPDWSEEKYQRYKAKTLNLNTVVYERFKQITEENVVDTFNNCYVGYWDDFINFFYKFNIYKCISKNRICDVLKGLRWNTYNILQDKSFVEYFDEEITILLEEQQYGLQFVVSYYLEEHDKKIQVYIPRHFTIEKRVKLIEDYLKSDDINPNFMKLILNAKYTKELPITPKMKKMADKRNNEFWENNKSAIFHNYGFGVTFGPFENVKNIQIENSKWILEYDTGWVKDNTDYPTLLNNFIYLFEYIDSQARLTCVSSHGERHPLTEIFEVRGVGMYKKDVAFDMLESLSDIQMRGYVEQLIKLDINIEDIIKWFFETYLLQEFDIKDYTCNMPNPADSILSKCKTLASGIDGVLSKY